MMNNHGLHESQSFENQFHSELKRLGASNSGVFQQHHPNHNHHQINQQQ